MKKIALKNAARGTAFDYAGQSWILLENDDGRALCLSKDIIETRAFDEGNCNNFAVASSKEYLNGAYLDNLLEDVNGSRPFLMATHRQSARRKDTAGSGMAGRLRSSSTSSQEP